MSLEPIIEEAYDIGREIEKVKKRKKISRKHLAEQNAMRKFLLYV